MGAHERKVRGLSPGIRDTESACRNAGQVKELNDGFAAVAIGYELYRNNEQQPGITVRCELSAGSMTCGGLFEGKQVTPSAPYKLERSFWLWMQGLFALDMPWLLDGTVNMAQLQNGSARVPTVTVSGGTAVLIGDALNVARLKAIKGPNQKLTEQHARKK